MRQKVTDTKNFLLFKGYQTLVSSTTLWPQKENLCTCLAPFLPSTCPLSWKIIGKLVQMIGKEFFQRFLAILRIWLLLLTWQKIGAFRNHPWMVFFKILSVDLKLFRQRNYLLRVVATSLVFTFTFFHYKAALEPSINGFKGSLTRDFRLQVFFINQCPPGLWVSHWDHFKFFRKFVEIFVNECLSAVSTTPAIKDKNFEIKFFKKFS